MSSVKLGDVEGLMVKNKAYDNLADGDDCAGYTQGARDKHFEHRGFNNALDQMSSRQIGMNKEKLEALLHKTFFQTGLHKMNPYDVNRIKSYVNAIIANEAELLEVRK